jgi:hypothetical protein
MVIISFWWKAFFCFLREDVLEICILWWNIFFGVYFLSFLCFLHPLLCYIGFINSYPYLIPFMALIKSDNLPNKGQFVDTSPRYIALCLAKGNWIAQNFSIFPVYFWLEGKTPWKTKNYSIFSKTGKVKTLYFTLFSSRDFQVGIMGDIPIFVFREVHVLNSLGILHFLKGDSKSFCHLLVN